MTERKRVELTYAKARKKHTGIDNESNLKKLAIKIEQRRTLWISIAFLWGSMLCALLWWLIPENDYTDTLLGCSLVFFVVCSFEYFKTVLDSSKIKYHYLGEHNTNPQGILTYGKIIKDSKKLSNGSSFKIIKGTLYDKDDKDDSYVSWIYHKYNLYFKLDEKFSTAGLRVKRRVYLKAPLDAEYLLILSDCGEVVSAYLANAWKMDPQLFNYCAFSGYDHNIMLDNYDNTKDISASKNKLPMEILLLVLNALTWVLPIIIGIVLLPFTTFFTTKFAIEEKKIVSIINLILGYCSIVVVYLMLFI